MYKQAINAYQAVNQATMSGREVEAAVLTKGALKLKECQENWDAADREEKLYAALKFNQRVWTILQGELLREDNPLPKKTRINVLRLSAFIDHRIFELMASPDKKKINVIIDINNNLAAGLRTKPTNP